MKNHLSKVILILSLITTMTVNAFSQQTFYFSEAGQKYFTVGSTKVTFYPNGQNILVHNQYRLTFQGDKNLVLYNNSTAIWSSGVHSSADRVEFWPGGYVYKLGYTSLLWNAQVFCGSSNIVWVLQSDGNFVGYDGYTTQGVGALLDPLIVVNGNPFAASGTAGGVKNNKKRLN